MGVFIKEKDFLGYRLKKGKIVCFNCIKDEEEAGANQRELILLKEIEEGGKIFFCDRCGLHL